MLDLELFSALSLFPSVEEATVGRGVRARGVFLNYVIVIIDNLGVSSQVKASFIYIAHFVHIKVTQCAYSHEQIT